MWRGVWAGRRPSSGAAAPLALDLGVGKAVARGEADAAELDAAVELDAAAAIASTFSRIRKAPPAATKPTPGKVPGPWPMVTLAMASVEPVGEQGDADPRGRAPGANSRPASTPRSRSGASAALAAVASAPTRNGR